MELDAPMGHILRGILMVGATGVVQVLAQLALSRMMDILPSPPESRYPTFYMLTHSVSAVMILLVGHILQVTVWAVLYFYDWGAFKSFGVAMYFSLASFTTLGASELTLPPHHRHARRLRIRRRHDDVRLVDRPSGRRRRPHRSPRPAPELGFRSLGYLIKALFFSLFSRPLPFFFLLIPLPPGSLHSIP